MLQGNNKKAEDFNAGMSSMQENKKQISNDIIKKTEELQELVKTAIQQGVIVSFTIYPMGQCELSIKEESIIYEYRS